MLTRLKTLWEGISTSLWFLPSLLTAAAVVLAWLALTWSAAINQQHGEIWWLHSGTGDNASDLLSSMLTSMITMATLAISITMVVLTLAAGQLGPRLIRSFMADKRTQLTLGFFLATIVYIVLVLRTIDDEARGADVPHLAVTLGTLSVLISVFLLLFFVHHLARSTVADTIIRRVGASLDTAIDELLPEADDREARSVEPPAKLGVGGPLSIGPGGYIQAVDYAGLASTARRANALVELRFRPGQHVLPDGEHALVHPAEALDDDLLDDLRECVFIGAERTASQDLEYSLRQLVEIALRALSTGVNDPFTAIAVIDRLGVSMALVMRRGPPQGIWCDKEGEVRVVGPTTLFSGLVDAAFNQIRQAAERQPAILIRLMGTLAQLAQQARHEEHRRVLLEHVNVVAAAGKRSIAEHYDLIALEERRSRALTYLEHV
jgi:uncharacterized membrane protein